MAPARPEQRSGHPAGPLLAVSSLSKRYGEITALDDVGLSVAPGEVHGLLGPNGAGKTTLLSAVVGLLAADGGTVSVAGHPVGSSEAAGLTGGSTEPAFWPQLTGRGNLRALARLDGAGAADRVEPALARVGLADRADRRVGGWSLGMRQRLAIAAALLRAPRLLVLDEPTNGLDPQAMGTFRSLVRELAADGVGVLLSSHAVAEVAALADRVTVLAAGRVVFSGGVPDLIADAPDPEHLLATSDDEAARALAAGMRALRVTARPDGVLAVTGARPALDAYVLRLAAARVVVRRLEPAANPLEALFHRLTSGPVTAGPTGTAGPGGDRP